MINLYALYQIQQIFDLARNLKYPLIEFLERIKNNNIPFKDINSQMMKIEKKKEFAHNFQKNILNPFKKKDKLNNNFSFNSIFEKNCERSINFQIYLKSKAGTKVLTNPKLENDQKMFYIIKLGEIAKKKGYI